MGRRTVLRGSLVAAVLLGLFGVAGTAGAAEPVPAAASPALDPALDAVPTTIEVSLGQAYAYNGDEGTLTATVTPNPGGGTVLFNVDDNLGSQAVVIDPTDGTATLTVGADPGLQAGMLVEAWFTGTDGFASSGTMYRPDIRYLPNIGILEAPDATRSADVTVTFWASADAECRLDATVWAPCTSPHQLEGLAEGHHDLDIRSFNPDGRRGPVHTASFDRDLTPPVPGELAVDDGIASTNTWNGHTLHYPATDALSGIVKVRVSRVGTLDADGSLWLDPALQDAYDRRWIDGPSAPWYADLRRSGPQTTWVQWFDEAGNASAIEQVTVDVRSGIVALGGLWSTVSPTVPFSITGIDPSEIRGVRITNGWPGDPGAVELDAVPSAWTLDATGGPGLRTVSMQWKDATGSWSSTSLAAVRLVDAPVDDLVLDWGSGVTRDPVVQGWTSIGTQMDRGVTIGYAYSCDGATWSHVNPVGPSVWIFVDRAEAGCPAGDGERTIHVRFLYGASYAPGEVRLSEERVAVVDLQRDPALPADDESEPQGSVTVAGGLAAVTSSTVALAIPATDDDRVVKVRLSNDGITWTERAYTATQSWALPTGNGRRTVWVRWRDAAGSWSQLASDAVVVDTVRPTVTTPRVALTSPSRTTTAGSPEARITWSGGDTGSGVARYVVEMRVNGGSWTLIGRTRTPVVDRRLHAGATYQFRVRAVDRAGNTSASLTSAIVSRVVVDDASGAITWTGAWRRRDDAALVRDHERVGREAGATARLTVTGRGVAWVATTGPGRGVAKVLVDGVVVATVDLDRPDTTTRRVVWAKTWASSGTHRVTVKVVSPRVGIDAFVVLR